MSSTTMSTVLRSSIARSSIRTLSTSTKSIRPVSASAISRATALSTRSFHHTPRMASIIQATAQTAHKAFANLASAAPLKVGDAVPDVEVKINNMEEKVNLSKLTGKNVFVLVPGAFSPACSDQVPAYIKRYDEFKSKGVNDVYVIAINDMFVMQAWRKKLLGENGKEGQEASTVKFVGDDQGTFGSAAGLVFDAQAFFGGPRLQRGAIVAQDGKVVHVAVENAPPEVTVSHADEVIKAI